MSKDAVLGYDQYFLTKIIEQNLLNSIVLELDIQHALGACVKARIEDSARCFGSKVFALNQKLRVFHHQLQLLLYRN
jgi:hypothetical protein